MTSRFKHHAVLTVFSLTLFLSAGLMFSFQPMIGKMLLPIVGGSPSGWMVAVAFFQIVLLAGYLVAHLLSRLTPQRQAFAYIALLCAGSLFLPVTLAKSASIAGDLPGPADVLLLLTVTVAVPFLALSATSSTLQRLFTATDHPASGNPYFLYVASNLGSFAGLLLYPLVIEPSLRLSTQSAFWLFGYMALILAGGLCLYQARKASEKKKTAAKAETTGWQQRLRWVVFAFVPSSLMMGLTFYVTTEIISMPLLWVIPLGLYLLTFIIAFSDRNIVSFDWLIRAQPIAVTLAIATIFIITPGAINKIEVFALHSVAFTIIALLCHLQLAKSRPADGERDLTLFYLLLAVGGALGGILNAFVAPFVFNSAIEYPLLLIGSCLLNPVFGFKRRDFVFLALAGLVIFEKIDNPVVFTAFIGTIGEFAFPIVAATLLAAQPRAALIGCGIIALGSLQNLSASSVYQGRNFYGVLKVYDLDAKIGGVTEKIRYFARGTTVHGKQILAPGKEEMATSYFVKEGPMGDMVSALKPKNIAVVGLGAGTIACYGTPQNNMTFFEIDPQVQYVAEHYFTFLSKCDTGKTPNIILGDARLSLKRDTNKYDLLVLDAFSSDAVPTHLMTKEAISLYFDRIADNGVLLFHISNRHFSLAAPLIADADALNLANRFVDYVPTGDPYADESVWVAMARHEEDIPKQLKLSWKEFAPEAGAVAWTDDYVNLLGIMHF